jgi:ABC-type hemin transport system substrate-binding protein
VTGAPRVRVVSLVPSVTETLLALGGDVVACTRFCEQPGLRHVGGTKNPDVPAIVALRPDLVVLDEEENRREDADALAAAGLRLLVTAVRSMSSARAAVVELATATGLAPPPDGPNPPPPVARRRAFVPIWRRPWMALGADTYGASLLDQIGVDVVTGGAAGRYPAAELDRVAADAPDLLLVPSEPFAFLDRHVAELAAALPSADVLRVDGQDLFWWGVRTPAAAARLRSVIGGRPETAEID